MSAVVPREVRGTRAARCTSGFGWSLDERRSISSGCSPASIVSARGVKTGGVSSKFGVADGHRHGEQGLATVGVVGAPPVGDLEGDGCLAAVVLRGLVLQRGSVDVRLGPRVRRGSPRGRSAGLPDGTMTRSATSHRMLPFIGTTIGIEVGEVRGGDRRLVLLDVLLGGGRRHDHERHRRELVELVREPVGDGVALASSASPRCRRRASPRPGRRSAPRASPRGRRRGRRGSWRRRAAARSRSRPRRPPRVR